MKSFQLKNSEAGGTVIALSVFIAFIALSLGLLVYSLGEIAIL